MGHYYPLWRAVTGDHFCEAVPKSLLEEGPRLLAASAATAASHLNTFQMTFWISVLVFLLCLPRGCWWQQISTSDDFLSTRDLLNAASVEVLPSRTSLSECHAPRSPFAFMGLSRVRHYVKAKS